MSGFHDEIGRRYAEVEGVPSVGALIAYPGTKWFAAYPLHIQWVEPEELQDDLPDLRSSTGPTVRLSSVCANCGDTYPDGAKFCITCGATR